MKTSLTSSNTSIFFGSNSTLSQQYWANGFGNSVNEMVTLPLDDFASTTAFCLSTDLPSLQVGHTSYPTNNDSQIVVGVFHASGSLSWSQNISSDIGLNTCKDIFLTSNQSLLFHIVTDGTDLIVGQSTFDTNDSFEGSERSVILSFSLNGNNFDLKYEFQLQALIQLTNYDDVLFGFASPFNHTFNGTSHQIPINSNSGFPYVRVIFGLLNLDSNEVYWSKSILGTGSYSSTYASIYSLHIINSTAIFSGTFQGDGVSIDSVNYSGRANQRLGWITSVSLNGTNLHQGVTGSPVTATFDYVIPSVTGVNEHNNSLMITIYRNCGTSATCSFDFNNNTYQVSSPLQNEHATLFELNLTTFNLTNTSFQNIGNNNYNHLKVAQNGDAVGFINLIEPINLTGETHSYPYSNYYGQNHAHGVVAFYNHSLARWVWSSIISPNLTSGSPSGFFQISSVNLLINNCAQISGPFASRDVDFFGVTLNNSGGYTNPGYYTYTVCPNFYDLDGDGYGDEYDDFPNDSSEWVDSDGDGYGDNGDEFPNDSSEWVDSDGDGYGDNGDEFPNDSSEWVDSDGDGYGDNGDEFPNDSSEWADSDGDGVGDNSDQYSNNSSEWVDSDGDGYGDNGDEFPNDSSEWADSDGDGVGDNSDQYSNNSSEWVDSDGDGYGDNGDEFPNDSFEWADSDNDGVGDNSDICSGYNDNLDLDSDGIPDGCDDYVENGDELCEAGIYANLQASRTCSIPQGDMDWDGLPDEDSSEVEADEDRDGDGKMDLIELSDSIVGTDVDSMDMSVISSPDLEFVHSITATTGTNQIEIIVEYKMTMSEMVIVLPLIAYTNEDGTLNDMTDWDLDSATELNRLEQQMCISPNTNSILDDGKQPILHWLENFSFEDQYPSVNWDCEWVERRSVDLMMLNMMLIDPSQIANSKETVRYTLILNTFDTGSENTIIHIPISNGTSGKVWELKVETPSNEQTLIYHPWIEKGNLVAPNPTGDQTSQDDTSSPSTPAVTPTYTSAWSIIVDVKEGSVDCSGYSDSVNDDVSWDDLDSLYQQNDIDYSSLSSYHEYSNYDDNIYVSCSGNVNFEQAMDGMEDEFCAYLFLYGELKQSKCDSGSFALVTLSGQKTTLQEDLDNFEQDLTDLENQWESDLDDLFDTGNDPDSSDIGAEIEDLIDSFLFLIAFSSISVAVIARYVQKQKLTKAEEEVENQTNSNNFFDSNLDSDVTPSDNSLLESHTINSATGEDKQETADEAEEVLKDESETKATDPAGPPQGPPPKQTNPPSEAEGVIGDDGYEWLEFPEDSGKHFYRAPGSESWETWDN